MRNFILKNKKQIEEQLKNMQEELFHIQKYILAGSSAWRITKSYINALEWVLDLE